MFKKLSQIFALLIFGILFSTTLAIPALAQQGEENQSQEQGNETVTRPPIIPGQNQEILIPHQTGDDQDNFLINQFLPSIAATIISITGGLALLFAVFNGIMMIASGGDPEKFGKAKQGLIWALIGIIIAGLSFAIVAIISSIRI